MLLEAVRKPHRNHEWFLVHAAMGEETCKVMTAMFIVAADAMVQVRYLSSNDNKELWHMNIMTDEADV